MNNYILSAVVVFGVVVLANVVFDAEVEPVVAQINKHEAIIKSRKKEIFEIFVLSVLLFSCTTFISTPINLLIMRLLILMIKNNWQWIFRNTPH